MSLTSQSNASNSPCPVCALHATVLMWRLVMLSRSRTYSGSDRHKKGATVRAVSGRLWDACRWEEACQDRQHNYCMTTQLSCCCSCRNKRLAGTSSPVAHLLVLPHAPLP